MTRSQSAASGICCWKVVARLVVFGLPADGLEPGDAGKLAVQALDHALDPHALEMRVAGRGDEDANRLHGRRVISGA